MPRNRFLKQSLSLCLAASLVLPLEAYASASHDDAQQTSSTDQRSTQNTEPATTGKDSSVPAPQSAGASQNGSQNGSQNSSQNSSQPNSQPNNTPNSSQALPQQPSQPQEKAPPPRGTAAAPDTRVDGVPAATPSGAAIAPAKQKRVRRFSIRTALVVGTVIAVGTVAGLSLATSAKPSN
ncbi:hypothetical protein [Terriglobus albidus]|uniref:hypothetical protein n=1 Tax=Terriglobus albidus TaxID=1592106 RepID=UPI0021E019C1|nr:hypothetical protein [Terriglobus albidus]